MKNPLKNFMKLLGYIFRGYKIQFFIIILCIIFSSIVSVISSVFIKSLVDKYIEPYLGQASPSMTALADILLFLGIVFLAGVLATYLFNRLMIIITQGVSKKVRDDMFEHMEKLPIKFFDTHSHGDIMSTYTNDTDTLRQMISQSLPQLLNSIIIIIGTIVSMLVLNAPLTVVVIIMILVILKLTSVMGGRSGKYFGKQQKDLGQVNGYIEEIMEGQKVVKVFCHEDESVEKFQEINENLFKSADKANSIAMTMMPIMISLTTLMFVLVALFGSVLAINNIWGFTIGGLAAFLQLTKSFSMPVSFISQQANSIIQALAGAARIFDLIEQKPEEDEGYITLVNVNKNTDGVLEESEKRTGIWAWKVPIDGGFDFVELKGDVVIENLKFGYNDEKIVLENINVFANPGHKIAFVGSTGAGKTTITNLINRFYDIQDGIIKYDGIDIKNIRKSDLRRSLGMVLQDTSLFTGTIMENIRYGKLDATDEEVMEAARLSNAEVFIKHLPHGFNTVLTGDGANLSQGQRQLLSIARAAVADPPVLILDEATSSIDTRTERIVQEGMDRLMKGRTVFVIAHRLSTVKNSDIIMVLENGEIIERGSHESLIGERGKYYQLYTGAFELS